MSEIYYTGTASMPTRFYEYRSANGLTEDQKKELIGRGWLKRTLTAGEEKRLRSSGCLGDLLDSFPSMYGVTCYNK